MTLGFIFFGVWDLLLIPGLLLGLYAQMKLKSTYHHYSQVPVGTGYTGAQAARAILDQAGLSQMPIKVVPGHLTDHYDPTKKELALSEENYYGRSLAAVGVAAHEAGHALQHKAAYSFLQLRMLAVPATQIASFAYMPLLIIGFLLGAMPIGKTLIAVAIGLFAVITLFQIITLPVEFDASRRAKEQLLRLGLVQQREGEGVAKVLSAAAMTYVAAMVASVLQLLRLIMIARGSDRE